MSITQDNLNRLSGYPLDVVGSIAHDNVEKLRTFSTNDARRLFANFDLSNATASAVSTRTRRVFSSILIP